jgi:hypothetical protein
VSHESFCDVRSVSYLSFVCNDLFEVVSLYIIFKLTPRDAQMNNQKLAEQVKKKNIIDMAVGFTAMMRFCQEGSGDSIKKKLEVSFEGLEQINTDQDFDEMHRDFCQWFIENIRLAKSGEPPSYGHAAKILDIALKVYIYYCKMPTSAKAETLVPLLNGAIDTPILRHLFKKLKDTYKEPFSPSLWTIKMINKEVYDSLQKVIRSDIKDSFKSSILPVQYDDIMWRRLNR